MVKVNYYALLTIQAAKMKRRDEQKKKKQIAFNSLLAYNNMLRILNISLCSRTIFKKQKTKQSEKKNCRNEKK